MRRYVPPALKDVMTVLVGMDVLLCGSKRARPVNNRRADERGNFKLRPHVLYTSCIDPAITPGACLEIYHDFR